MADAFRAPAPPALRRGLGRALLLATATVAAAWPREAPAQREIRRVAVASETRTADPAPLPAVPPGVPTRDAPDPRLSAEEVVGILLDALARADAAEPAPAGAPAAGDHPPIALVFGFSSPANRAVVGTLERFERMVRDDAYRPLLGHTRAVRGAVRLDGGRAVQRVVVTSAYGERVAYVVTLARQTSGPHRGCWMTDAVLREPPGRIAAPLSA